MRKDAKKVQHRGRAQQGPESEAPHQGETFVVPADVQCSDTMDENQDPQQETMTAQEPSEKKKLIKVLLEEEKEEEVLEWIKSNPTLYNNSLKGYKNKSEKDAKWNLKAEELGISGECYVTSYYINYQVNYLLLFQNVDTRLPWPSQIFPDHARFPPMCSRLPNDRWRPRNVPHTTRPPFIPNHSRLFWTVRNSREHLDRVQRPLRTLPDQPPPFPDLPQTLQDLSRPARSGEVGQVWPRLLFTGCVQNTESGFPCLYGTFYVHFLGLFFRTIYVYYS